jgi:hypothetical protein
MAHPAPRRATSCGSIRPCGRRSGGCTRAGRRPPRWCNPPSAAGRPRAANHRGAGRGGGGTRRPPARRTRGSAPATQHPHLLDPHRQGRECQESSAAALLPPLALDLIQGLSLGDDHQEPPEVVAVGEPGAAAAGRASAEAVEGAEGRVLLVGDGSRRVAEPQPREPDEAVEVVPPQLLRGLAVAGLQLPEPAGDGRPVSPVRHGKSAESTGSLPLEHSDILTRPRRRDAPNRHPTCQNSRGLSGTPTTGSWMSRVDDYRRAEKALRNRQDEGSPYNILGDNITLL